MKRIFINQELKINEELFIEDAYILNILNVLRLNRGDAIEIFNDKEELFLGKILELTKKSTKIFITEKKIMKDDNNLEIVLALGFPKAKKFEFIIEKACELNVTKIYPFLYDRSIPKITDSDARYLRWKKILIESCRQCGRINIPDIERIDNISSTIKKIKLNYTKSLKIFFWEEESSKNIRDILTKNRNDSIVALIGAEGGFSKSDAEFIKNQGFIVAGLGDRILKCETAVIVAMSMIQYEMRGFI